MRQSDIFFSSSEAFFVFHSIRVVKRRNIRKKGRNTLRQGLKRETKENEAPDGGARFVCLLTLKKNIFFLKVLMERAIIILKIC